MDDKINHDNEVEEILEEIVEELPEEIHVEPVKKNSKRRQVLQKGRWVWVN